MKRQDMIDTLRKMGWRPVGFGAMWRGVQNVNRNMGVYRLRQTNPYIDEEGHAPSGVEDLGYCVSHTLGMRWSDLCDDEVLRFYLKIMMEGL